VIDAAGPWGTGPFILASGVSQLDKRSPEVVLDPNPTYWNPDRKPASRMVFDNIISKADAIRSVESGDGKVDIVTQLLPAEARAFSGGNHAKLVVSHAKTVLVGVFNQNKPNSPWKDIALRRAMNMAVDRNAVLANAGGGYGMVIPALIQPGRFGSNPSLSPYPYDAAKAKAAISAAKIPDNQVVIAADESLKPVVDDIAKNLAAVGLTVKPDYGTDPGKDWDIKLAFGFDWTPTFPVGVLHREFLGKDGAFRAMPENTQFDAMYAKLLKTTDETEQEKQVQAIEAYTHDQADLLFLYSPAVLYAVSNRVHFVPYDTFMLELAETGVNQGKTAN